MSPDTEGPEALIGREIAGYRLERVLGIGLTGAVFFGRPLNDATDQPDGVAIKVLLLPWQMSAADRATFRTRFAHEAEILQQVRHPHIVSVLAAGEEDGLTYMVMPYLSGGTLAARLAIGRRPLAEADRYLAQLASALDYAHAHGIIHRDVKPQNVLLDDQGNAQLADFSIARLLDETRPKLTSTSHLLGTPAYMAPEQLRSGQVSAASDQYSLGALLYELVTGQVPFEADSLPELALKVTMDPPALPRSLRPELPEPAEAVIWQALSKQPEERFASATALAQAFAAGLQSQWDTAVRPIVFAAQANSQPDSLLFTNNTLPPVITDAPTSQRLWPRVLGIASLCAVALLIVGLIFSRNSLGANINPSATGTRSSGFVGSSGATPTVQNQKGSPTAKLTATLLPLPTPTPTLMPGVTPTPMSTPSPLFGDGRDGDLNIYNGQVANTDDIRSPLSSSVSAGQSYLPLTNLVGFATGQEVFIIQMQGTGAGANEFAMVQSINSGGLILTRGLAHGYRSGGSDTTQILLVRHYQNMTVSGGGILTVHPWDGSTGGVLVFRANGTLDVQPGGAISVDGDGFRGGVIPDSPWISSGYNGESYTGSSTHSDVANGGGGAGGCDYQNEGGSGGGYRTRGSVGGGNSCAIASQQPGYIYGDGSLSNIFIGSGGGSAGGCCYDGGNGAGAIVISAQHIVIAGGMHSNGANGSNGGSNPGGGGGSGGSIKLTGATISLGGGQVSARGGIGGTSSGTYGGTLQVFGGNGGDGGIAIAYCNSMSGYTSPGASTQQVGCL